MCQIKESQAAAQQSIHLLLFMHHHQKYQTVNHRWFHCAVHSLLFMHK